MDDSERIIRIETKQDILIRQFENHLRHHWAVTLLALSAALTGCCSFIVGLLLLLFNK